MTSCRICSTDFPFRIYLACNPSRPQPVKNTQIRKSTAAMISPTSLGHHVTQKSDNMPSTFRETSTQQCTCPHPGRGGRICRRCPSPALSSLPFLTILRMRYLGQLHILSSTMSIIFHLTVAIFIGIRIMGSARCRQGELVSCVFVFSDCSYHFQRHGLYLLHMCSLFYTCQPIP